jgi:hypothetical protein
VSKAEVYDVTPSQLRGLFEQEPAVTPEPAEASTPGADPAPRFGVMADMADGIEAVHQCLNLTGFTERPRAFILALCDAAYKAGSDYVELTDKELAELQGCSTRTVRRQRNDYLEESRRLDFSPVEVLQPKFDPDKGKYPVTPYRLHLTRAVELSVREARASSTWHETDRRLQRAAIKRAAATAYHSIPGATAKRRRKRRPRPALAEIETYRKVITKKLEKLKRMAESLPEHERARLTEAEGPGELYGWWLEVRAEMDAFLGVDSPQTVEGGEDERQVGQRVRHDAGVSEAEPAEEQPHSAEDVAAWEGLEGRMSAPQVKRVVVELRPRGCEAREPP